ncbi:hypothetical protein M0R89_19730 (plasmid) [Halorussus limi]|uniref:Uncharacterized protein n=1 Tax=Halorussus limi TaxID=2938695 RepID=A0A8U0I041_9EURY|nr:hypothetical protein [Halorussus limi]UPV76393.1 hypothetical protein M0R89_19730 [Halorussus limi]
MADSKSQTALKVGGIVVGALVAFVVVVPLLPVVLEFAVGIFRGFFDAIVPGGRTYE